MSRLVWDAAGQHFYETGCDRGVLFPMGANGYDTGIAWNGLTGVTQSPSGGDPSPLWADNIKYANPRAAEEFGGTIEAYTYPEEFEECDGSKSPTPGMTVGQQARKAFGFAYRTRVGNELVGDSLGYKIHVVWNATASPSERSYSTVNDSPEAINFSWEFTTTAVDAGEGYRPTSLMEFDSTKLPQAFMTWLENTLYGVDAVEADAQNNITEVAASSPTLPSPAEIIAKCSDQSLFPNG